jgi:hypothetical protein
MNMVDRITQLRHAAKDLDDKMLEEMLCLLLREYLYRQPRTLASVNRMKDSELLTQVRHTYQDTRSSLARGGDA